MNLIPGLYRFTSTALITGADVTLTGCPDDVWLFQIVADLQLGSGIKVILAGGAQAKNIFWQVGSSAVLGTFSVFKGTIMADQAITMDTSSTIEGRALARIAGVTFNGSGLTVPANSAPALGISQTCPTTPAVPGGMVIFNATVTNTGNIALTNVQVVSDQPAPGTVVLTIATLPVGGSSNFTTGFLAPLNSCTVTTTLGASVAGACGTLATNFTVTTCPLTTTASLALTLACPTAPVVAGGSVTYTGTVLNTGAATLTNVVVMAPGVVLTVPVLLPGVSQSFNAAIPVPADACSVSLAASATGGSQCTGATARNTSPTATCPVVTAPGLTITMACVGQPRPGGLASYSGTVSNSGNITLTNVLVVHSVSGQILLVLTLAPGATANYNGSFQVPADCSASSTTTATGTSVCGGDVSNSAAANCSIGNSPALAISQTCPTTPAVPGGMLIYDATVTNTGNIALNNVQVVSDHPAPGTVVLTIATLPVGGSSNFTTGFLVPLNSCTATMTLGASGASACGGTLAASSTRICPLTTTASLAVTLACPTAPVVAGGSVTYTGTVMNTGTATLTNVVVMAPGVVLTVPVLLPGVSQSFNAAIPVPADACSVSLAATATGGSQCTGAAASNTSPTATCPVVTAPGLTVTMACVGQPRPGGLADYSGTVSNSGNITLNNVIVVNSVSGQILVVPTLAPGATATYNGSFPAPADCSASSTTTASGTSICGGNVSNSATANCSIGNSPALGISQTCPTTSAVPGGMLIYNATVTNAGNIALTNVQVVSDHPAPGTVVLTIATLPVSGSSNFTAGFLVPLNSCTVTTTLGASGASACGGTLATSTIICPLTTTPSLAVALACPTAPIVAGGIATYTGTVMNTGTATLTNVVVTAPGVVLTVTALLPGVSQSFNAAILVPADACSVSLAATATGGSQCTGATASNTSPTATCPVGSSPSLTITMACVGQPQPGGVLNYGGTVNNSGNTALTNVIVVNDHSGQILGPITLAPGQSANYNGSYPVPADCSTSSTTTATGTTVCGGNVSHSATTSCPIVNAPQIQITQDCPTQPVAPGGVVTFSISVCNVGTAGMNNVAVVADGGTLLRMIASLPVGTCGNFTASVTAGVNVCSVSQTVSATGTGLCGGSVTATTSSTCPLTTSPSLDVVKRCPQGLIQPGSLIVVTGTVTNTGNITLTDVVVTNTVGVLGNTSRLILGPITLAPGEGAVFGDSYTAPLDSCGPYVDAFVARGSDRCFGRVVTDTDLEACGGTNSPSIAVYKTCLPGVVPPGQLLTVFGAVTNTGNITLTNVIVWNNIVTGNLSRQVLGPIILAPGAGTTFTDSYPVPLDSCGPYVDTLVALGRDQCFGQLAEASATATCSNTPSVTITLGDCPPFPCAPDSYCAYSGTVSNTGNVTLTNVMVAHSLSGIPVFVAVKLAPGAVANFNGYYYVPLTATCSITTTVTASGFGFCGGACISDPATRTCSLLSRPGLKVVQTCLTNPVVQGGVLTYRGVVRNTGNTTLTNIVVVNNRPNPHTVFGPITLTPGDSAWFTGSYLVPTNCCVVSSTLMATATEICGQGVTDSDTAECTVTTTPRMVVALVCPTAQVEPGDPIRYTGIVSNAGNVTLIQVVVTTGQGGAGHPVLGPISLAPGESVSYNATFTVPLHACTWREVVTATARDACDVTTATASAAGDCPLVGTPRIAVSKTCPTTPTPKGGLFTFTGKVTNVGNVPLTNVMVINNAPSNNTPVLGPITLSPGASADFIGSYLAPTCCCVLIDTLKATGQS